MNTALQYKLITNSFLKKQIRYILFIVPFLLSSCIHDEPGDCPTLQVQLVVKDKNYFNADQVSLDTPKSESLAFREYIPTLYYTLRNADTGEIVEEQGVFNVTGNEPTQLITFCDCLPHGKYALTVWGGIVDNTSLADNSLTNIIHSNGAEGNDIYLAHDTLVYDINHTNYTVNMERVTGKLLIQTGNLPASVRYAAKRISKLYERVNYKFDYLNPITVNNLDTWEPTEEIVMHAILAPSAGKLQSMLHLDFYETAPPSTPDLTPKDVYITMKRNELTTLKYVYDDERRNFSIFVLSNDGWEIIYDLNIN